MREHPKPININPKIVKINDGPIFKNSTGPIIVPPNIDIMHPIKILFSLFTL